MDSKVSAALTGLLRASTAVDEELQEIEDAHPRDGFPHAELLKALPPSGDITERTKVFAADVLENITEYTPAILTNSTLQLSALHTAAIAIRSAVKWSGRFTAIDWWVDHRLKELGLPGKKVLLAPGQLGNVTVERTSRFREVLVELEEDGRLLSGKGGDLAPELQIRRNLLDDIHLLRVPPSDGISPLWHPLVLGHELAHLKYTYNTVRRWVAKQHMAGHGALAEEAIAASKDVADKGPREHFLLTNDRRKFLASTGIQPLVPQLIAYNQAPSLCGEDNLYSDNDKCPAGNKPHWYKNFAGLNIFKFKQAASTAPIT